MTSKLTRERLQEIAEDGFLKHGESKELARMALAAMDSEPVAWLLSGGGAKNVVCFDSGNAYADPLREVTPLYRHAHPAPVVQCPFPCGWDNLNKLAIQDAALVARGLVEGELTTEAHRQAAISNNDRLLKVISAYRAAMLHAGNSPAKNQGWIPVSERIPEIGDIVLTAMGGVVNVGEMECSAANYRFFASVISGREFPATHWMPLPAAPQEVKGE